jgi:Tfp pilus assembly protein PilO
VTRRNTILIVAVAGIAAVAAYWMLVLAPKRQEAALLSTKIATKQRDLATAQGQLATYEKARDAYKDNYTLVARLGKAVPADDDVRSLMVQVNSAADRSSVDFRTIAVGGGAGAATTAADGKATTIKAPPPGAATVGTAGFAAMPFTFSFTGSYLNLSKFMRRLDRFVAVRNQQIDVTGRLLLLNTISLTPDATTGFPKMNAQISATSYLLPPTEGLLAGASAAGPGAATPAGTTAPATPAPTTPAPTTATISGATR